MKYILVCSHHHKHMGNAPRVPTEKHTPRKTDSELPLIRPPSRDVIPSVPELIRPFSDTRNAPADDASPTSLVPKEPEFE